MIDEVEWIFSVFEYSIFMCSGSDVCTNTVFAGHSPTPGGVDQASCLSFIFSWFGQVGLRSLEQSSAIHGPALMGASGIVVV